MKTAKYILLGLYCREVLTNGPIARQRHHVAGTAYEGN